MDVIIPLMLAIPVVALFAIAFAPKRYSHPISTLSAMAVFILSSIILISAMGGHLPSVQYAYIPHLNVQLSLRATGVTAVLLMMASTVLLAASLSGNPEHEREKQAGALIMLFELSAVGLFSTGNLLLFFIFWDIGVVALFFMINLLGSANRRTASMNFLLYEIFASALLLIGIILIYAYTPAHSLNIQNIASTSASMPVGVQEAVFVLLFVAFMTNMPVFPMHFWLPDAHTEASTQGSMLLSGILTKFGGFGMLLLFSILPISSKFSGYIAMLAAFSVIYSVLGLMRQSDIKRVVAYSTIVEMGIVLFAISALNPTATTGAVYGMLSHGLVVALMFLAAGSLKYVFAERDINILRGVVDGTRSTAYSFLAGTFAMLGLPLSAGFIADVFIFLGAVSAFGAYGLIPLAALVLLGGYFYYIMDKSIFSVKDRLLAVNAIGLAQKLGYAILIGSIIIYGLMPSIILGIIKL